jgi:hypothetical protein
MKKEKNPPKSIHQQISEMERLWEEIKEKRKKGV